MQNPMGRPYCIHFVTIKDGNEPTVALRRSFSQKAGQISQDSIRPKETNADEVVGIKVFVSRPESVRRSTALPERNIA